MRLQGRWTETDTYTDTDTRIDTHGPQLGRLTELELPKVLRGRRAGIPSWGQTRNVKNATDNVQSAKLILQSEQTQEDAAVTATCCVSCVQSTAAKLPDEIDHTPGGTTYPLRTENPTHFRLD